jgi:hypothetical protein
MIETMVRCPSCGEENPPQYRFCGMCGKPVNASTATAPQTTAPIPPAPVKTISSPVAKEPASRVKVEEDIPFNGPSFLGLSGSGSTDQHAGYLLDDEEENSVGHRRMYLALLILVIAAGMLGWRWYYGGFPWQSKVSAPAPATSTVAQSNSASAPAPQPTASQQPTTPTTPANTANTENSSTPSAKVEPPQSQPVSDASSTATATPAPNANDSAAGNTPASGNSTTAQPNKTDDQAASSQPAAAQPASPQPKTTAQLKENSRVSKAAPKKVSLSDEDSSTSEGQALLTQGERYLYGTGVAQNCGRAEDSLRSAADHGNAQALSDLATMYSTGHCVLRNLPTAYKWFVKALHQEPNNTRISDDLQVLWNQMSPEEKQQAMQSR